MASRRLNVFVTGASSGIGLATALLFARRGHSVHAGVRAPECAVELHEAIATEGLPISLIRLDVDHMDSVRDATRQAVEQANGIDVLVNNAGIGGGGPIEETPVELAQRLFDTNYFGPVRMIQALLPDMRRRHVGVIVNVSSVMGRFVFAAHGHYCAAKHALEAMTEALAQEVYRYGIRVALIEPGVVATPIFSKNSRVVDPSSPYADHVKRLIKFFRSQLNRPTIPDIVAATILDAVTTSRPKLRYVVGADAESLLSGRRALTDEDWLFEGRAMADAEWSQLVRDRYGIDLS